MAHIPMRLIGSIATIGWWLTALLNVRVRMHGTIRAEFGRAVIGLHGIDAGRSRSAGVLEKLIDQRIYFGRRARPDEAWPELQSVAATLASTIRTLRKASPDTPIIVSPFHYVSQYANIYVVEKLGAALGIRSLAVISGVPRDTYGDDHAMIPGVNVLYTYGDDNRNGLGLRVARSLKRNGVCVLFADVPPFTMHRYPMETVGVSMFGRPARIHNGVFRLGAPLGAVLLPFYLTFERGAFHGHLYDPISLEAEDAPQRLADRIESTLSANYAQWLPGGHPSMYAFAPTR